MPTDFSHLSPLMCLILLPLSNSAACWIRCAVHCAVVGTLVQQVLNTHNPLSSPTLSSTTTVMALHACQHTLCSTLQDVIDALAAHAAALHTLPNDAFEPSQLRTSTAALVRALRVR